MEGKHATNAALENRRFKSNFKFVISYFFFKSSYSSVGESVLLPVTITAVRLALKIDASNPALVSSDEAL